MLLAKERSKCEVVNDFNSTLVALYRYIQWHLPALLDELRWMQNSRQTLHDFIEQPGLTELQRVARWFILNRISFAGNGGSFRVNRASTGKGIAGSNRGLLQRLAKFRKRMERVTIENLDYRRFMKLYDSAETFFFLDPPYLDAKPKAYAGWNRDQMREFRDFVHTLKGSWIITIDDSEYNRELFAGCQIDSISLRNGCVITRSEVQEFGEIIIRPAGQLPRKAE